MAQQIPRLGFLASHNGSSMRAILAAIRAGTLPAEAVLAASNNAGAPALAHAAAAGLATLHASATSEGSAEAADRKLADAFAAAGATLLVLSGYMRKLGPALLARYRDRILNIHPALLPKFGGAGMYGDRVHAAVLAAGERESGATIHLVDEEYDHGRTIAQARVPVLPGDTVETLRARVAAIEPRLYVETLQRIAEGAIRLPGAEERLP